MTQIPLIDFAPFLTGGFYAQQQVAQALFQACQQVGFLYLQHHGIPQRAIDQTFEQSQTFFALPLTEKQGLAWSSELSNRGYVGMQRERLDETQPGDLKEAFNVGPEIVAMRAAANSVPMVNRWPRDRNTFQPVISEFFGLCELAVEPILQAFAMALSMPKDYFVKRHQTHNFTLRLLHYPPLVMPPQSGQLRAGVHSDYGTLTLLFQDQVGGLEVLSTQGQWIAAPAIPDTVLINTGDLLQRWSNDVFCSTKHRVSLPQAEKAEGDRYSIAFFCDPDADTEITCLPTCKHEVSPPNYPPVNAKEYLLSRLQATY